MADFYAARAGTNAGAPLDGFLTAVHNAASIDRYKRNAIAMSESFRWQGEQEKFLLACEQALEGLGSRRH